MKKNGWITSALLGVGLWSCNQDKDVSAVKVVDSDFEQTTDDWTAGFGGGDETTKSESDWTSWWGYVAQFPWILRLLAGQTQISWTLLFCVFYWTSVLPDTATGHSWSVTLHSKKEVKYLFITFFWLLAFSLTPVLKWNRCTKHCLWQPPWPSW